ncbi:hypothetical protein GCM10017556_53070 [Micromonospora sagamiensis]|nr:hypothetical protein GCM10017556_53070 [Micromonospora sagamiensis]
MTAPFLSLAQIRNRLILTARAILRDHRPGPDGRCPICRTTDCPVATAARNVLRAASEVQQPSGPTRPGRVSAARMTVDDTRTGPPTASSCRGGQGSQTLSSTSDTG